MKIGFIGFNKHIGKIINQSQTDNELSIAGIYASRTKSLQNANTKHFTSPEELAENSDILYISCSEPANEISQYAIKKTRHLFFESPFCLTKYEFDKLFNLANETNSHIKFSQEILQKQIYREIKSKLNPHILKFNIYDNQETILKQHIFDFVTLTREIIKSGIRKIYHHKVPNKTGTAQSLSLNILFDNGKTAECFLTQITNTEKLLLQAYQESITIEIDFKNNYATISSLEGETVEMTEYKKTDNQDKTIKDLILYAKNISNTQQKPLIVREENYHILSITHELINTIQQSDHH
ncbi:MAG: hypothetical protein R6U04_05885 [Bacteroidales bacterium]